MRRSGTRSAMTFFQGFSSKDLFSIWGNFSQCNVVEKPRRSILGLRICNMPPPPFGGTSMFSSQSSFFQARVVNPLSSLCHWQSLYFGSDPQALLRTRRSLPFNFQWIAVFRIVSTPWYMYGPEEAGGQRIFQEKHFFFFFQLCLFCGVASRTCRIVCFLH